MRAIKLNTHVAEDRTLRLKLPEDVQVTVAVDPPGEDKFGRACLEGYNRLAERGQ